jgi:hypothetical protein
MTRGRPFEPGNKLGRGRPKGSRNQNTQQAHKLFERHATAIMALAISKSREDRQMLRMLASRIAPRQRDLPVQIGPIPMNTLADLDQASATTLKKATSGRISLHEALDISSLIENRRRVLLDLDLERRLSVLEKAA